MNFSVESMLKGLAEQGMCFTSSEQRTTGEYDSADAEWNYKDVPHLKEAHENAEAINGALSKVVLLQFLFKKWVRFAFLFQCAFTLPVLAQFLTSLLLVPLYSWFHQAGRPYSQAQQ